MSYNNLNYIRYKDRYLSLKRDTNQNNYQFIYFDDINKQKKFINNNKEKMIDMMLNCSPLSIPENLKNIDPRIIYTSYLDALIEKKWFFILSNLNNDNNIIGFCYLTDNFCTKITKKSLINKFNPYKINDLSNFPELMNHMIKNVNNTTLSPEISSLCKDPNFKNVGSFLLDNILTYCEGKYEKVYLVPESIYYKNNFSSFIFKNMCDFDNKKYWESNMKLINYYKSQGFQLSPNLFIIEKCNYSDNKFNVLNVMFKNIK